MSKIDELRKEFRESMRQLKNLGVFNTLGEQAEGSIADKWLGIDGGTVVNNKWFSATPRFDFEHAYDIDDWVDESIIKDQDLLDNFFQLITEKSYFQVSPRLTNFRWWEYKNSRRLGQGPSTTICTLVDDKSAGNSVEFSRARTQDFYYPLPIKSCGLQVDSYVSRRTVIVVPVADGVAYDTLSEVSVYDSTKLHHPTRYINLADWYTGPDLNSECINWFGNIIPALVPLMKGRNPTQQLLSVMGIFNSLRKFEIPAGNRAIKYYGKRVDSILKLNWRDITEAEKAGTLDLHGLSHDDAEKFYEMFLRVLRYTTTEYKDGRPFPYNEYVDVNNLLHKRYGTASPTLKAGPLTYSYVAKYKPTPEEIKNAKYERVSTFHQDLAKLYGVKDTREYLTTIEGALKAQDPEMAKHTENIGMMVGALIDDSGEVTLTDRNTGAAYKAKRELHRSEGAYLFNMMEYLYEKFADKYNGTDLPSPRPNGRMSNNSLTMACKTDLLTHTAIFVNMTKTVNSVNMPSKLRSLPNSIKFLEKTGASQYLIDSAKSQLKRLEGLKDRGFIYKRESVQGNISISMYVAKDKQIVRYSATKHVLLVSCSHLKYNTKYLFSNADSALALLPLSKEVIQKLSGWDREGLFQRSSYSYVAGNKIDYIPFYQEAEFAKKMGTTMQVMMVISVIYGGITAGFQAFMKNLLIGAVVGEVVKGINGYLVDKYLETGDEKYLWMAAIFSVAAANYTPGKGFSMDSIQALNAVTATMSFYSIYQQKQMQDLTEDFIDFHEKNQEEQDEINEKFKELNDWFDPTLANTVLQSVLVESPDEFFYRTLDIDTTEVALNIESKLDIELRF